MANYKDNAVYKVRKWMIAELYAAGIITQSDYVGVSPVVPIQQIPESFDAVTTADLGLPEDAPFIVWDLMVPGGYDTDFWNCRDELVLWIYDYEIGKALEIKNFLYDLFRRYDQSAADINSFSDSSVIQFHYFDVMMGLPTDEVDQVLGRSGVNMVVSYQYTRAQTSTGRFA